MSYALGQYNYRRGSDSFNFLTEITSGEALLKQTGEDQGVGGDSVTFYNPCVRVASLNTNTHYYFHGKIKRMASEQIISIKLINYNKSGSEKVEQFIKTVVIAPGIETEWVDIEFIFTPYMTFDTILFELRRTEEDYRIETRHPKLIYIELSVINNLVTEIMDNKSLIRIGVQSRPGAMMCINGDEIRVLRTGIYEIRNTNIMINFFSVINPAEYARLDEVIESVNAAWAAATTEEERRNVKSRCLFGMPKTRLIDSFTLDYLYREE